MFDVEAACVALACAPGVQLDAERAQLFGQREDVLKKRAADAGAPGARGDDKFVNADEESADPELRPVLITAERALRDRSFAQAKTLFGKDVSEHPGLERALDFTLQFMIGAAMTAVLHTDDGGRLRELMDDFKQLFPTVLTNATTTRRKVSK